MTAHGRSDGALAMPLGPGFEFDTIRRMAARWGDRACGLGDDAAVLSVPRGDRLVASTDSAVEGRHFRRDWLSNREIGYRAVVAALSDLAAMGAAPLGILVAMTVPRAWRGALDDLADGILDAVRAGDTVIRGGNLSDGSELSITTTVLGHARSPLGRSGARAGDQVYVTGSLGGAAAAVASLERGETPAAGCRRRFAAPMPRIREGRWLSNHGATAAIDVSDGLSADVGHLAAASGVRIEVEVGMVPCVSGVGPTAAIASGEEYELVVCAPEIDTVAFLERFHLPLTPIGHVAGPGTGELLLIHEGHREVVTPGHDHFSP